VVAEYHHSPHEQLFEDVRREWRAEGIHEEGTPKLSMLAFQAIPRPVLVRCDSLVARMKEMEGKLKALSSMEYRRPGVICERMVCLRRHIEGLQRKVLRGEI
jgi:hypothetical protein